jgi:hypothetical protein
MPENQPKWKAPSCRPCNNKLSKHEQHLLIRLGLCIDPYDFRSLGIADLALKSLTPSRAKKERDQKARAAMRAKILKEMETVKGLKVKDIRSHVYTNFGDDAVIHPDSEGVLIDLESLNAFSEKLVRGTSYVLHGHYIDADSKIDILHLRREQYRHYDKVLSQGRVYQIAPGTTVKVLRGRDTALFSFDIWGRLRLYATVQPQMAEDS